MLSPDPPLVLLQQGGLDNLSGKTGLALLRYRRGPIVGLASIAFAFFAFLGGLAVNAFMFFWTRFFTGLSKANTITVHSTLLADAYPIAIRGRMYSLNAAIGRVFAAASPVLVGGIAVLAGGLSRIYPPEHAGPLRT